MVGPFRILVVCTGNICRSPMAQAFLADGLRQRLGDEAFAEHFVVESAGTHGLTGEPIEPSAAEVLGTHGVALDTFAARVLAAEHIDAADLVLTATRDQRAAVVTLAPDAVAKSFTLREFARLAAASDESARAGGDAGTDAADAARQVVADALALRGSVRPDRPADDDVADPYGRPRDAFIQAGAEIKDAVDVIVGSLVTEVSEAR